MSDELIKQLIQELNSMRVDIKDLTAKLYKMPCERNNVRIEIMWKGFWGLVVVQSTLFLTIIVEYLIK